MINLKNIEKLLYLKQEYVVWVSLWEATMWNKKFKGVHCTKQKNICKYISVSAKELKKIKSVGDIKLLSTGIFDGFTNEKIAKNFNEGEVLTIPEGGNAIIKYWNGKFVNALNLIAVSSNKEIYNLKYIYYYLLSKNEWVQSKYKGSSVKHPSMRDILELKIPFPNIEIQNEIVKILDTFNEHIRGLEAELEARKKQYDYYLNLLFDKLKENGGEEVLYKKLGDIVRIQMCKRILKKILIYMEQYHFIKLELWGKRQIVI